MRHVYPTNEIPHLWAHQTQQDARNAQGNLYFRGPTIYSYRDSWPLARIFTKKGAQLVLTNCDRASVTTAKHQGAVNRAVNHLQAIAVPYPSLDIYAASKRTDYEVHLYNLAYLEKTAAEFLAKSQRALQVQKVTWRAGQAQGLFDDWMQYAKFFGIRRKAPVYPADAWTAAHDRAQAIENPDPARDAKRFKALQAREIATRAKLQGIFDDYSAAVARYNERCTVLNDGKSAVDLWRENTRFTLSVERPQYLGYKLERKLRAAGFDLPEIDYSLSSYALPMALRVNGDQIETTQGARIPLEHAPITWALVQACRSTGREYKRNGHTEHAGVYAIDSVSAEGELRAGCHTIPYAELARLAAQLGFDS